MSVYSIFRCRNSSTRTALINALDIVKSGGWRFVARTNYCTKMAQKPTNNSGSYVSIPIADTAKTRRFLFFTRHEGTTGKKRSEFGRLLSLAKPERWRLLGAIVLLFISSAVTMAVPFSLGKVLDVIYTDNTDEGAEARRRLNRITGILLVVFVMGAFCNFGRTYIMSTAGYRIVQSLRRSVFSAVLKQEQAFFDMRSTGELINRLSADTQIVGNAVTSNISDGLRSTIMVLAGTGMMFYMSPELALVGLAIVPPVAGVAIVYGRFVRKITKEVQDTLAAATQVSEERISNIRTVKSFSREQREMFTYAEAIKNVLQLGYQESRARAIFYALTGFSGHVIIITVLYYGGVMVASQEVTVGNLSSFLLYAAYIGVSLGGLSSFYSELNKSMGAAARLWEILDLEPEIPIEGGITPTSPPLGHIVFDNISFRYPSRDDVEIFCDFNLDVAPGKTVAVVGPSGSGKSTLAALLLRLYDPTKGQVLLDEYDIRTLDPRWLRKYIGSVSQEPVLFSTTIRDNILYGADDPASVTEEHLLQVVKEANVYEFAKQLPQNLDTVVGERGVMLSGGQKQRVAIARALIKDPKILLLDEATSALDAQSEFLVQEALEKIMKGRTVLTIAHRLSTIQNADTIAVIQNGKVVEMGSYAELSAQNGAFKELIKHQTFGAL